jgi:hypothetical protein
MNTRTLTIIAAVLSASLLTSCRSNPAARHTPTPAPKDLKLEQIGRGDIDEPYTFPISRGPGKTGTVIIEFTEDYEKFGQELLIQWDDGTTNTILCDMWGTNEVGVVDLYGPDDQAIIIAASGGGTGGWGGVTQIINPTTGNILHLKTWQSYNSIDPLTNAEWSENADDPRFAKEREYLEELKYELGYLDEETFLENPDPFRSAVYLWGKSNGDVTDGVMTIQRHPGKHPIYGTPLDELVDGDITYSAMFKGAVWAYDASADESFVVFHPDDHYAWPEELAISGDWLLINSGEGLIFVNVKTWYLKRVDVHVAEITSFDTGRHYARINDSFGVTLPDLSEPEE